MRHFEIGDAVFFRATKPSLTPSERGINFERGTIVEGPCRMYDQFHNYEGCIFYCIKVHERAFYWVEIKNIYPQDFKDAYDL